MNTLHAEHGGASETAGAQQPVWTTIFLSSRALAAGFVKQNMFTAEEIEKFLNGLGQAHRALVLVDVASKKEADDKMRGPFLTHDYMHFKLHR